MKVYIVYELYDYGLWDISKSKVFLNRKDAESYNEHFYKRGYYLDIAEYDVE
jgi:hypothetical protein